MSHTSQQIEPKAAAFLTQTESELIREITVSMSQDTEFVLKLARAAEEMEAERKQSQKAKEEQEQENTMKQSRLSRRGWKNQRKIKEKGSCKNERVHHKCCQG